jgi:signal recognition particle GTPase
MDQPVKTLLSKLDSLLPEVTSLAVTKLDGTAKGGVVIEFQISLRFL